MKFIHSADLFAAKPSWRIKGQRKASSNIGLLFTLFLLALFIWACWFYSYDMVHRTNPLLTQAVLHVSTFDSPMTIDTEDFPFAFGMLNLNSKTFYTDPTLFTIKAGVMDDDE